MIEALAGVASGLLAGLVPGVHVNNLLPFTAFLGPYFFIPFSIAWLFSSAFPSILLGVPSESLAVLPGHRLVLAGRAREALVLCTAAALLSLLASVAMLPLLAVFLPVLYEKSAFAVPYLLFAIVAAVALSERGTKKPSAAIVVAMSSALGFLTFSSDFLLPLLSGFFGLSTLLASQKGAPPAQRPMERKIPLGPVVRSSLLASFLSSFFGFLPGVSSGITAYASRAFGRLSTEGFLAVASGANASYLALSLFALTLIGRARSGTAAFLQGLDIGLLPLAGIILFSGAVSAFACIHATKYVIRQYSRLDYRKIALSSAVFIIMVNLLFTGIMGLLILSISTSIGLFAIFSRTKRINCMASLAVPVAIGML